MTKQAQRREADLSESLYKRNGTVRAVRALRQTPGYNGVKEVPTKIMLDFICKAKSGMPRPSDENDASMYVPAEKVLEMIEAPAIIERFKAYLAYAGRPTYLEYVTKPAFELKLKRLV